VKIVVQNGNDSFTFRASASPYQRDKDRLWEEVRKNCCDGFMEYGGREAFEKHCNFVLLRSEQFCFGISSPNIQFPLSLNITATLTSRRIFACGSQIVGTARQEFPMLHKDAISAVPCVVAIYMNRLISIAADSADQSAASYSQADYIESLARSAAM
jgi:hypothetical protein